MQRVKIAVLIFAIFALAQCGRDRSLIDSPSNQERQDGSGGTATVRLLLFAAGNCGPCREELPLVRDMLQKKMGAYGSRLIPTVYFEAGNAGEKPNAANSAAFKSEMGLPFEVVPDTLAKKYRSYYGTTGQTPVPATVIAGEDYSKIQIFAPGVVDVNTLEASLVQALK